MTMAGGSLLSSYYIIILLTNIHVIVAIAEGVDHVDDYGGRLTAFLLQYYYVLNKYSVK